MNPESEIEVWRTQWKETGRCQSVDAHNFRIDHNRQRWWLRLHYFFGLAFAALLICYAAFVLRSDFRAEVLAWAVVVWITTLVVTGFSVWNWRGLLGVSGRSVREYADAYERRSMAMLRAIRFGYWFLGLQLSITAPWITIDFLRHQTTVRQYVTGMGFLCALSVAFVAWFGRSRRKAVRELNQVEELRQGLGTEDYQESTGTI